MKKYLAQDTPHLRLGIRLNHDAVTQLASKNSEPLGPYQYPANARRVACKLHSTHIC